MCLSASACLLASLIVHNAPTCVVLLCFVLRLCSEAGALENPFRQCWRGSRHNAHKIEQREHERTERIEEVRANETENKTKQNEMGFSVSQLKLMIGENTDRLQRHARDKRIIMHTAEHTSGRASLSFRCRFVSTPPYPYITISPSRILYI